MIEIGQRIKAEYRRGGGTSTIKGGGETWAREQTDRRRS